METIRTVAWMKERARAARQEQRIIGLVATMGALHAGHLALVERAKRECSPVYASIFLNPKQFAANEDLSRYPRPLEADVEKLTAAKVDELFLPETAEIYPAGFSTYVNVEGISERLEGKSRAGHFRGVSTVVLKLLEIVQPHFAYFGRKDAQQVRIVQQMVHDLNLDTEIVVCPIVREADGLAMSSRNAYLKGEDRTAATVLNRALRAAEREIAAGVRDSLELQRAMGKVLAGEPRARVDYAEIVDAETFEPVVRVARRCYALLAVYLGKTRLIDNMLIEPVGEDVRVKV
ncbi:MAG TPA: pantoate--beta-alanine ligase [Candidatus Limnocylindrales bacterium]|nr:pantoate--beta-alanine ligase [Candidatus Limnocylindrales bacterium]